MSKILLIIIPWLHYHSLSLESELNKRIGNEASTMSRLSNNRLIAHTMQGHGLQSLPAGTVSKQMKWAFSRGFCLKTISFVHTV